MSVNLTPNSIAAIISGDLNLKPVVQVLDIKPITDSKNRFSILLSDGIKTQQGMLAAQLGETVKTGGLRNGSVIQLIDYLCSFVQNKPIVIVLNMQTIVEACEVIGNPEQASTVMGCRSISKHEQTLANGTDKADTDRRCHSNLSGRTSEYHPVQQSYQPPPSYKNHGPIVKNQAPPCIIPIAALNPYQGRWMVKARVTAKCNIRRYNNARGDGKVFSFDLLDSEGGEIRATCFNSVVDRFFNSIDIGKVYQISKGSLKPAQKNFNHLRNEWEIFLDGNSVVELCPEEDSSIPKQNFCFRSINEIEFVESNSVVDIIGIVVFVNPSVPILRKNGMETQRRVLSMKDSSDRHVELTLWGDFCNKEGRRLQELHDSGSFPVLAAKSVKVSDFGGKSVGTIFSTQLFIDPDLPEARKLMTWFEEIGRDVKSQPLSRDIVPEVGIRKTISRLKDEGLGRSERPDWVTVKGTLIFLKTDSFCYTACPLMVGDRQCNKKVARIGSLYWKCDRCDREFEECDYRYILQAQVQDHTGLLWITAFQEAGVELLHCSAKELYFLKYEEKNDVRFREILSSSLFKEFLFKLKLKEENYGDENKVKITLVGLERVNIINESNHLLNHMARFPA